MVKQRVRVGAGVGGSKAKNSDDVNRGKKPKGSIGRDRSTVKRLHMYRTKSVKRDRDGKILDGKGDLTSRTPQDGAGRTAPNRKWFGNTRVIEQKQLQKFREQMQNVGDDTYSMLLKRRKVPMALLTETTGRELEGSKLGLLANETFEDTFSKRHWRKKPKLNASAIEELAKNAREKSEQFDADEEDKEVDPLAEYKDLDRDRVFDKGQSKRIWGELHKVIDSSDVILQVIDARDPQGTRCFWLERFVKKECAHKHLVLVLNKVDLVPTAVTARWLRILSKEFPTVAMHSSITNSYGKGTLINLLRQFGKLHSDRKSISCGLVGYPNVGKSSVINTLRGKKVANVAPIPGETKVWQYITLFRHIFLVDCPGVVHESGSNSQADSVMKGVVRVESLADTAPDYISAVLERVEREYVVKTYGILSWKDSEDFLEKMAQKTGKLLKNAEPDISAAARKVLLDFQRGKLPWFVPPPRGDVDECEPLGVIEKSGAEDRTENGIQLREQTLRGLKTKNDVDLPEWKDVSDEESESNEDEDSQENED